MCLLVPFLPSCLLKIYLELKQATHGGRSLFTGPGNRTPRCSFHHLQLAFETPATNKITPNLHVLLGRLAESCGIM